MTIILESFFCFQCQQQFTKDKIDDHGCKPPFKILRSTLTCKQKRYARFIDWFLSRDITYGLAFMGALVVNLILISHLNLNFKEALFEGLGLGFLIPRLIK